MKDDRDILETLRAELSYIEKGGDGRGVRAPLVPTSPFQDSLTRPDFGYPYRAHPSAECLLNDFVHQPQLEEQLKAWLRARHTEAEIERAEAGTRIYRHDGRPEPVCDPHAGHIRQPRAACWRSPSASG